MTACGTCKEKYRELGRPYSFHDRLWCMVKQYNRKGGCLMLNRESDYLIVLRGRESRPRGEGTSSNKQPVKETHTGQ